MAEFPMGLRGLTAKPTNLTPTIFSVSKKLDIAEAYTSDKRHRRQARVRQGLIINFIISLFT